jgi:hypothetical protein
MQKNFCAESDTLSIKHPQNTLNGRNSYKERIYVSHDKSFYLSGEHLRFKIYCLDADRNLPSALSKVAYLEVMDTSNNSIIQTKILLTQGIGFGDIFIPSNINSGNYILRCYTKWMRNSGAEEFFHTIIPIINPFRRAGLLPIPKSSGIMLKFNPDGGNLVYGLKSKIAFLATNSTGNGIAFMGSIMNESDSSLLEFGSLKSGLGSFFFRPEPNRSYYAKIMLKDSSKYVFELPKIKTSGYIMHVNRLNGEDISIEVRAGGESMTGNLYLEGYIDNRRQFKYNLIIDEGSENIFISRDQLDQGLLQINLKNSLDQTLNHRKVIIYPRDRINLNIKTDKDTYGKREKVIVKIKSRNSEELPVKMDLSVSASIHHAAFDKFRNNIDSYLLFNEMIKANPNYNAYFNDCQSEQCRSTLDNLLLVNSDSVVIQSDLKYNSDSVNYIPEFRHHIIAGKLTNKLTKSPEEGVMAYLSIPSKKANFLATQSKQDGVLFFELPDNADLNKIIVQTDNTNNTNYNIEIEDPYSKEFANINVPRFDLDITLKNFIEKTSTNMQVRNAYLKYSSIMEVQNNPDSSTFYDPDAVYYLDDYTRFPVMEEVMREYVGGVYVRRNQEGFHFKILDLDRTETFQENPLILIDGIPVFDADEIMDINPLEIKKIETVRKRYIKDGFKYSGIVSFFTYKGDLQGYKLQENVEVIEYDGIQAMRKYIHPEYVSKQDKDSRIPDYRNVLYWNPKFQTNDQGEATLEFFTSDDTGEYELHIEGISNNGRTALGKLLFHVVDNPE